MTTPTVSAPKSPTHVAFYPGLADARVEFHSDDWTPVNALVAKHGGVPKIEALSTVAATVAKYSDLGSPATAWEITTAAREAFRSSKSATGDDGCAFDAASEVVAKLAGDRVGTFDQETLTWEFDVAEKPIAVVPEGETEVERAERIGVSSFGGELKADETAKARIEAQHAALGAAGITVNAGRQLFATGTRMATVGYENQAQRKVEHDKLMPLRDAAEQLREAVRAEKRRDIVVSARSLVDGIEMNGGLKVGGWKFNEHAVRSLLGRIDSPASRYVFGLRQRIVEAVLELNSGEAKALPADEKARVDALQARILADKKRLAGTVAHELWVAGDAEIKLRVREATGDCFAALSTSYSPADAPEVIEQILGGLPADAKGSYSYDAATTSWELRADVWTPTPVAEQAVGEAFRGYVSFRSKDNGSGSLKGGGGIELLACLNASTYTAADEELRRNHVGAILADAAKMTAKARNAIDALCEAWGVAREKELMVPADLGPVPLSVALPGFWFGELEARKGELAGVLPGRTREHVKGLTAAYLEERRDPERLVKADMAQAWTRYIQDQPTPVRRDAESAVASWLVSGRPVRFDRDRALEAQG